MRCYQMVLALGVIAIMDYDYLCRVRINIYLHLLYVGKEAGRVNGDFESIGLDTIYNHTGYCVRQDRETKQRSER